MRRTLSHIAVFTALLAALFSCGPRKIPKDDLEKIYYDMFVLDQYLVGKSEFKRQTDTSLVYEGILEKYGYTTDDYLYSMEQYLRDADRFSKLLGRVAARLTEEAKRVQGEMELRDWKKKWDKYLPDYDMDSLLNSYVTDSTYLDILSTYTPPEYL